MRRTLAEEAARIRSSAYKEQRYLYRQTKKYKTKYCSEEAKLKRHLREQTPEFKARRNAGLAAKRSLEAPARQRQDSSEVAPAPLLVPSEPSSSNPQPSD